MAKRHQSRAGDLQSIFIRLEELVLANSGQDEFQEIFKLTVAKLYDEKFSKSPKFIYSGDSQTTFDAVQELMRKAEAKWPGVLPVLPQPLLTPDHLAICVQELQKHVLLGDSLQALDEFFEFIVSKTAKGSKGQYFTPRHLVEMCVRMINPKAGEVVADPACGSGGFLLHAFNHMRGNLDAKGLERFLWGFDMDERAIRIARSLLIIAGLGSPNVYRLNSLLSNKKHDLFNEKSDIANIESATRVRASDKGIFDVILTNPPFAGEIKEPGILDQYELSQGRKKIERDVLFIERCIRLLKPGGRMAIVLPHNKLSSAAFSDVRSFVLQRCHLVAVVGVGRNMFMPHTQQKTGVVFLEKKLTAQDAARPVFFAIGERDGKDSRGNHLVHSGFASDAPLWDRLDHDLDGIVHEFQRLQMWGR